ncbi:MAG: hypothetical protein GY779_04935 [Gammaproteobacteria bacterium]|nr:hypothetical protein [Gammaproteobacteria bacterium]
MTVFKLLKNTPLVGLLLLIIAYVLSPLFHYQLGPGGFNDQRFLLLLFGAVCLLSTVLIPSCPARGRSIRHANDRRNLPDL